MLDASKFGAKEYTPYEVYIKALYEYFREELGEDPLRSAAARWTWPSFRKTRSRRPVVSLIATTEC